jgi:hypothetical protein
MKILIALLLVTLSGCGGGGSSPAVEPPQAPALTLGQSAGVFELYWTVAPHVNSYTVYWSVVVTANTTCTQAIAGWPQAVVHNVLPPYTITGFTSGQKYCFAVMAVNAGGETMSNVITAISL